MRAILLIVVGMLYWTIPIPVLAQGDKLHCSKKSKTIEADNAIWRMVRTADRAVLYARYLEMHTSCHIPEASMRLKELLADQEQQRPRLVSAFSFGVFASGYTFEKVGASGAELGGAPTVALNAFRGQFKDIPTADISLVYKCVYSIAGVDKHEPEETKSDSQFCGWNNAGRPATDLVTLKLALEGRLAGAITAKADCRRVSNGPEWGDCATTPPPPSITNNYITAVRVTVAGTNPKLTAKEIANGPTPGFAQVCDGVLNPSISQPGDITVPREKNCIVNGGVVAGHIDVGAGATLSTLQASVFGTVKAVGAKQLRFNYLPESPPQLPPANATSPTFISGDVSIMRGALVGASVFAEGLIVGRSVVVAKNEGKSDNAALILCTTQWCHQAIHVGGNVVIRGNKNVQIAMNNTYVGRGLNCSGNSPRAQLIPNDKANAGPPLYWPLRNVHASRAMGECVGFSATPRS